MRRVVLKKINKINLNLNACVRYPSWWFVARNCCKEVKDFSLLSRV